MLVEVADDHVEAVRVPIGHDGGEPRDTPPPISWRGLEVEIVEGERKLLDRVGKRLIKAGARRSAGLSKMAQAMGEEGRCPEAPTDAKDSVQQLVQHRLAILVRELRARDPLVREGLQEGVHSMRVAIRRLRSLLATGRPFMARSVTDPLRAELAWLAEALGEVRDAEVRRSRLDKSIDALVEDRPEVDWEPGRVRSALWSPLVAEHDRALVVLDEVLTSERYALLLDQLRGLVADPPWTDKASKSIGGAYRRRTRRELDRVHQRMEVALDPAHTPDERGDALHEARKAVKRARYAVEPLGPVYGDAAVTLAKRLKKLQSAWDIIKTRSSPATISTRSPMRPDRPSTRQPC